MIGVVACGLIDHDVATRHEPYRDEYAGNGKEFNVAVHVNSDERQTVTSTRLVYIFLRDLGLSKFLADCGSDHQSD